MSIIKIIENKGDLTTSSSNGKITINQTTGEIAIRKGVHKIVKIDDEGFTYFDQNSVKRISMGQDNAGLQQIVVYGANGTPLILVGQDPKDGTPVIAVSDGNKDVLTELKNG